MIACGTDYILSSSYDKTARLWYFDPEAEDKESEPCVRVFEVSTQMSRRLKSP